jgi:hypothetical protein
MAIHPRSHPRPHWYSHLLPRHRLRLRLEANSIMSSGETGRSVQFNCEKCFQEDTEAGDTGFDSDHHSMVLLPAWGLRDSP